MTALHRWFPFLRWPRPTLPLLRGEAVAALTVVDMVKAVDKAAVITDVRVESKTGGKSGPCTRA